MYIYLIIFAAIIASEGLEAKDIVFKNSAATIPIDPFSGSVVEFSRSIKEIDYSHSFSIEEIVKNIDEKTGKPVDIKSIRVLPKKDGASDHVRIRFSGGRSCLLWFVSKPGANSVHRLYFRNLRKSKHASDISKHIAPKIKLMRKMLLDREAPGFSRIVLSKPITKKYFSDVLDFNVVRL